MEEPNSKTENDIESSNLLYKYQYAFLHMQKSFTSLFKVIKVFEQKIAYKYLAIWKKILLKNSRNAFSHMLLFNSSLHSLEKKIRSSYRLVLHSYFLHLIKSSRIKEAQENLRSQHKIAKENNSKELEIMEEEVIHLKKSQKELENITKNYHKRELNLKSKLDHAKGKGNSDSLKIENKSLKLQIEEINKKTVNLFKELHCILDEIENTKRVLGC